MLRNNGFLFDGCVSGGVGSVGKIERVWETCRKREERRGISRRVGGDYVGCCHGFVCEAGKPKKKVVQRVC